MNKTTPPLFQRFPGLAGVLAGSRLSADLPTAVAPLPKISDRLWIKRDDLCGQTYGGNKWRKLALVMPHALQRSARRIVTVGGLGTHHGLATAIACRELGLACDILLFDQPLTPHVRENLQLMNHYGARLNYCGSMARALAAYAAHPRRLDPHSYFLFAGASNPIGVCAYIDAALELDEQITNGDLPEPEAVYCAVGSTGTLAGLTLGLQICGRDIPVYGVRVIDSHLGPFPACTPSTTHKLMRQTLAWIHKHAGADTEIAPARPRMLDHYFGDGYGVPTAAGTRAQQTASHAGITLDPTYTAKAFAAALDGLGEFDGPVLYWHTLSSADMSQALSKAAEIPMPESIAKRLQQSD